MPSSGIHSNGYSLVRKICDGLDLTADYGLGAPLGEVLLTPTRIYVPECQRLVKEFDVRSMVHITGGGFHENIPRGLQTGPALSSNLEAGRYRRSLSSSGSERRSRMPTRRAHSMAGWA